MLVVSVDVDKEVGQDTFLWQAVLLFPSSAMPIGQFHIEPPTGQHILDYSTYRAVLGYVVESRY